MSDDLNRLQADPREPGLPKWAQDMLIGLRRAVEDERHAARAARLTTDPDASVAILDPYAELDGRPPIGLGDSSVRFKLPGRAWVDVRVQGDWVICMSADQMLAHPQSGNVMALRSARRGEL